MEHYLQIYGSPANPEAGVVLLECESFVAQAQASGDVAQSCAPVRQVSGVIPAVTDFVCNDPDRPVAGETAGAHSDVTSEATLSSAGARSAPSDLFDLLESKPVWKIEELEEVLEISAKTLYKQAARGKLPAFRIGSCVRVYGKGLADHLRGKLKK